MDPPVSPVRFKMPEEIVEVEPPKTPIIIRTNDLKSYSEPPTVGASTMGGSSPRSFYLSSGSVSAKDHQPVSRKGSFHENPLPQNAPGSQAALGHTLENSIPLSIFPLHPDKFCIAFCGLPGETLYCVNEGMISSKCFQQYAFQVVVKVTSPEDLVDIWIFSMPCLSRYSMWPSIVVAPLESTFHFVVIKETGLIPLMLNPIAREKSAIVWLSKIWSSLFRINLTE